MIALVVLVQIFQSIGTHFATRLDKRITNTKTRKASARDRNKQVEKDWRSPGAM